MGELNSKRMNSIQNCGILQKFTFKMKQNKNLLIKKDSIYIEPLHQLFLQ